MYKKLFLVSLLFISHVVRCKAQDSSHNAVATVYFMRASGAVGLGAFNAFIDDKLVCRLNNNRYSVHMLKEGAHTFQARFDGKKPKKNIKMLDLKLKAGQIYYIMIDVTDHFLTNAMSLIEITGNTAGKMLLKLNAENNCK